MGLSDAELIRKAQHGDGAAFQELVYRYDKHVFSIAARYVNRADDAKDIYQEVFLRVYKGLPKFKHQSEFATWLYRITTNVCLTHHGKRKHRSHTSVDEEFDGDDGESHHLLTLREEVMADRKILDSEISTRVEDSLNYLTPQQKLVFTLRHYEGYKLREISAMMNCTEGTVKKHLFTATRRLRQNLKDFLD